MLILPSNMANHSLSRSTGLIRWFWEVIMCDADGFSVGVRGE